MSKVLVIRDPNEAQQFLAQSLQLQRVIPPRTNTIRNVLGLALEMVSAGHPLLPLGMLADLGHTAFAVERERGAQFPPQIPGIPPTLLRTYEDHLLGKIYADWTFERAGDALRRFTGRDRAIGLGYVVKQFRERAGLGGVELQPGAIRTLIEMDETEVLNRGWTSLESDGPLPYLLQYYEDATKAARRIAEVLALEDIIALEQRTALAEMGQYVAHRQILQMAGKLESRLPKQKIKPLMGRREVPTRIMDEDTYPVGGFTSISTKGTVESLLHSQLAYMEKDEQYRPDLFDIKFLRDELYYYSRDDNQFLRRRRTFLFALYPDLTNARFKDPELSCQRIVMVLSLILSLVNKSIEWLGNDALKFEFLIVPPPQGEPPLKHEVGLLQMLFREQLESEIVEIKTLAEPLVTYADAKANRSQCHVLAISAQGVPVPTNAAVVSVLKVDGPKPALQQGLIAPSIVEGEDATESWSNALQQVLGYWV